MLIITTHYWGEKYPVEYVRKLHRALKRNVLQPFRFIVITDAEWRFAKDDFESLRLIDTQLIKLPGCVCRLRLFDPLWQSAVGIEEGDRVVSVDIDLIITRTIDPLVNMDDDFVILQGINTTNPCPYNGSIFMLKAGTNAHVWNEFNPETLQRIPFHSFPDDQGWLHVKVPNAGVFGPANGVYGFKKVGWPSGDNLPDNARIVAFPGWRDPSMPMFQNIPWIKEHWR